jgi:hypothetical protein
MSYRDTGIPISGDARGNGSVGFGTVLAVLALVALPAGVFLSKLRQERKELEEEKAEFRRLGWDWNQRVR